ncbi:NADH:ubiquinone oxidoreductase, partial [Alcanivorax sp.]|uniref:NADH-quinone oxidoreductase subunit B family protein n=1 Tax=Alcanivorax sp. TaxID=1872427 RepID=UPI00259109EF
TMSVLNMESPDLFTQLHRLDIETLFHPSLSTLSAKELGALIEAIERGEQKLDIFCLEGNVVLGPDNTGLFDTFRREPKKNLIFKLAQQADYVIAVGTCAAHGGFGGRPEDEMQGVGLQYHRGQAGGFLGPQFKSKKGLPVINLPGCPIHPKALELTLNLIARDLPLELDEHGKPKVYYGLTVHQGCTRNEYHEYKVEETRFGEEGCMFFHLGCKGPTTHASCNKYLWNEQSSKTRAGVPCFGCTRADFPMSTPFYETPNLAGTPLELPEGVDRAHYLAYKDMAAAAAPERLLSRKNGV